MGSLFASVVVVFLAFICNCQCQQKDANEIIAMNAFRAAWSPSLPQWTTTADYCVWTGVTCVGTTPQRVSAIDVNSNLVSGTIPTEIGLLTALVDFRVHNNSLTGTIPTQIGLLTLASSFWLYQNRLSGTIPTQFGLMRSMNYLYLLQNQLTGPIPPQLAQLTNLYILLIDQNRLSGTIPLELTTFTSLYQFVAGTNQLSGTIPSQFGSIATLTHFGLNNNNLTGTIPTQLYLPSLRYFFAQANQLTGTIGTEIGLMRSIEVFNIGINRLTGTLPTQVCQMTTALDIYVNVNQLTGTLPTQIGQLQNSWTMLFFHRNRFSGPIPTQFGQLTRLSLLRLDQNQLNGTIPTHLASIPTLNRLNVSFNLLTGTVPSQLDLLNYQWCYLQSNSFDSCNNITRCECSLQLPSENSTAEIGPPTVTDIGPTIGIAVGIVVGVCIVAVVIVVAVVMYRRRRGSSSNASSGGTSLQSIELSVNPNATNNTNTHYSVPNPQSRQYASLPSINTNLPFLDTNAQTYDKMMYCQYAATSKKSAAISTTGASIDINDLKMHFVLGEGNFGAVYLAFYKQDTPVAVKAIKPDAVGSIDGSQVIDDFKAEAALLARVPPHDNVLRYFGTCWDPLLLVTEYVDGGSLSSHITNPSVAMSMRDATQMMLEIAQGLQHLHNSKVIHRDLATRNVLLRTIDDKFQCVIGDMGMARLHNAQDQYAKTKTATIPLKWSAPESLRDRKFSVKSDVWSFGCVGVEISTRTPDPLPSMQPIDAAMAVATYRLKPAFPSSVNRAFPSKLMSKLEQCLDWKPENRPNTQQLIAALTAALKN